MKKHIWILAAFLLLAGCTAPSPDPTPTSISFTLNRTDMSFFNPGELFDLKARLTPEDAKAEVTWTSSDPNIASVSWNGRVTAISGGTVTITATIEGVGEQKCIVRCQFSGSATPALEETPEPTPVGIEVDIGDGEHTFWVELAKGEEDARVNIYRNKGDSEPAQSFVEEEGFVDLDMAWLTAEDVDFDGYMDFHFYTSFGYSIVSCSSYYVWDPKEQCFRPDPYGLNELSTVEFSPEWKQVHSLSRGPMGTMTVSYQYENGALVEVGESFYPEAEYREKAYTARWVTVDDAHIFWAELAEAEHGGSFEINIYREKGDTQPLQTLKGNREVPELNLSVEDMDFDSKTDLAVLVSASPSAHMTFSYYIWDTERSEFVPDPYGLNELCSVGHPELLPEEKAIRTFMRSRAGLDGEIHFYRYLKEGFTCVRQMFWHWHEDEEGADFLVEDYEDREMRTVYEETCSKESLNGYLWSEEFSNWWDLPYHGE